MNHEIDILPMKDIELNKIVWTLMKRNPMFNLLVCEAETEGKFNRFLAELKFNYNVGKNSFHNYHHAVNGTNPIIQSCI